MNKAKEDQPSLNGIGNRSTTLRQNGGGPSGRDQQQQQALNSDRNMNAIYTQSNHQNGLNDGGSYGFWTSRSSRGGGGNDGSHSNQAKKIAATDTKNEFNGILRHFCMVLTSFL